MVWRAVWAQSTKRLLAASFVLAFFIAPAGAGAANIGTISSVEVGGATITDGATVTRDSVSSISNFWSFNFTWPNFVSNNRAHLALFRGTFGAVEGGTLVSGQNYFLQSQAWAAGSNNIQKQFVIPQLGAFGTPSGTYTAVVADCPSPCWLPDWFATGGATPGPVDYKTLTFTYSATSSPTELPTAIRDVTIGGREIKSGDAVYRKELAALNGSTDNYWGFDFDWPNFVSNSQALFVIFRGTYGNVEGGALVDGTNYSHNLQVWPAGHNQIGKFMNLPVLKHASTTAGTYTILIAERDSKYTNQPISTAEALWFSSGGTQGIAPRKYSTLTFDFKADDPYPVIIVPGILGSAPKNGEWVLDPYLHTYDNLVETLAANGYQNGQTLFPFPYNWRYSNIYTATLLRDKINEVQAICHCKKVDVVAHSMGGLVARQYVQSGDYGADVGNLIFLGTPHLGAPKDYLTWEAGEVDTDIISSILETILYLEARENGYEDLFEYIQGEPIFSVRELLPIYDYIFDRDGNLKKYPNGYPPNLFLEQLKNHSHQLQSSGVAITNIIGVEDIPNTISGINIDDFSLSPLWEHGVPIGFLSNHEEDGLRIGAGDGTVPYFSASGIPNSYKIINSRHNFLPSDAEAIVYKTLTGIEASTLIYKSLPARVLMFRIFSPADLTVTAPDGKQIGRDGATEINQIPGAFYSGFNTDVEYVVIPNPQDGEYMISTVGTGAGGQYTVATNYITQSGTTQKDITGTIAPNQVVESVVELNAAAPDPLVVHAADDVPPVITISLPQNGAQYMHSSTTPIQFTASDTDSGIATTSVKLDGVDVSTITLDMFYQTLGTHTLSVMAMDAAGNTASTSVSYSVITSIPSTRLDVQRVYDLGWMSAAFKNNLLLKLNPGLNVQPLYQPIGPGFTPRPPVVVQPPQNIIKLIGPQILRDLDTQLVSGGITQQGYNIIKADIQWLIAQP